MKNDYLDICYSEENRPYTSYPKKLAAHLYDKFSMNDCHNLLEIVCGRGELLREFKSLGLDVFGCDLSQESQKFNEKIEIKTCNIENDKLPYEDNCFGVVFSKSLLEHLNSPNNYMNEVYRVLKPGGLIITLVPDWESCYKIYYDDYTHKTPFTFLSLKHAIEMSGFNDVSVEKFRQLPIIWKYPYLKYLSIVISPFVPVRTKNKFLRWSRELMLVSVGRK